MLILMACLSLWPAYPYGLVIPVPAGWYSPLCVVLCVFVRCHRRSEPYFDGIDARYHAIVNLPPGVMFLL